MPRTHTYLFEPGLWSIQGVYYDESERPHAQTGQIVISHGPKLWTMDSQIQISGEDKRDFVSRYEIVPFPPNVSYTEWKSYAGGPEPLFGLFVVVEETLLAPWQSQSGQYWGQEALYSQSPDAYLCRGFTFLKERKTSSWAVRLTRESGATAN
ncbi:MAG: hypothetical protein LBO66_13130 [Deltaproteobacteria bacterium]|jgi:hypothetical protein|nr:hypothetical protein [Deltaproteobacteria bacterium]